MAEALRAGAVGFSTSTLEQHNGENGIPMPSRLADEHELLELTGALGEAGKGVFMLTKGMNTTVPWLEQIAARNGRPVMIAAMFVDPNDPQRVFDEFEEISAARKRGRELWGHVGCFPLGMQFTLRHPYPLEALLAWRPAIEAEGSEQYQRVLADPSSAQRSRQRRAARRVPNRFSYHSLEHMTIMEVKQAKHQPIWWGATSPSWRAAKARIPSTGSSISGSTESWMRWWTASCSTRMRMRCAI